MSIVLHCDTIFNMMSVKVSQGVSFQCYIRQFQFVFDFHKFRMKYFQVFDREIA
jgi:hypothetical protein